MFFRAPRERWLFLPLAVVVCALYFFALGDTGLLDADEPRYASIGREMARSGDWITPRLWGEPWFEKPALLYWMTGIAFRLGLSEDLAPRLPVAVLSVAFLIFYAWRLREEFGPRAGWYSTVVLGTSAGWLGFSHVGVTDLPMSAAFSASMLLLIAWLRKGDHRLVVWAAALMGVAVLAKGLAPLVLALPFAWVARRRLAQLPHLQAAAAFLAVAAPWYALVYARNGMPFIEEFFLKHHFGRFTSGALQHVQPFWFYIPVMLAALIPWPAGLALLFRRSLYRDDRRLLLLLWLVFGLIFFSASTNKLPGYILPLLPPAAALMGLALAEAPKARVVLTACALALTLVPAVADVLPEALAFGLSRSGLPNWTFVWLAPALVAVLIWARETAGARDQAMVCLALAAAAGVVFLKVRTFPSIDAAVSARPIWRQVAPQRDNVCVENVQRKWRYGLNYYSVSPLPDCPSGGRSVHIRQPERGQPILVQEGEPLQASGGGPVTMR
ncbi:MAG: glycosyltransferase family 39 protein [Bryobacteraceae bacterium]